MGINEKSIEIMLRPGEAGAAAFDAGGRVRSSWRVLQRQEAFYKRYRGRGDCGDTTGVHSFYFREIDFS